MKCKKISSIIASFLLLAQTMLVSAEVSTELNSEVMVEDTVNENNDNVNIDENEFNNSIDAEAYAVIDSTTGELIMSKNADKSMYPASLTKVMTSLLLIESGKLNQEFLVSKEADEIGEASIYAEEGEKLSGKDLLYAMMLQSANDACYVVAEGVSGTVENFYALMTQRAKELGATDSNFTSANGLHEETHVSTAYDLALITKEALKHPEFREVMGAKSYDLTRTSEGGMKNITNKNRMLFSQKGEYNEYVIGGKTAYTTPAGNCLIEIAKKGDMEIVVVALKSHNIYPDTNKIINFALDNYTSTPIVEKGDFIEEYKGNFLNLYTNEGIGFVTPVGEAVSKERVSKKLVLDPLPQTVIKDSKVGTMNAYVDGVEYKKVDVFAKEDYTFKESVSVKFFRNIIIFVAILVLIKAAINFYKMRKAKTKGYLKNSKFY